MIKASDRLPSSSACFKFVNKCKISKFARFKFKEFSRIFKYFQAPYLFSSTFNHLEVFIPNSSIFKDFSSTSLTLCKCVSAGRPWVVPNGWTNRYFDSWGPRNHYLVGAQIPMERGTFGGSYLGMPRVAHGRYCQPYLLGDRNNAISGYQSTVAISY